MSNAERRVGADICCVCGYGSKEWWLGQEVIKRVKVSNRLFHTNRNFVVCLFDISLSRPSVRCEIQLVYCNDVCFC